MQYKHGLVRAIQSYERDNMTSAIYGV